jgi:hypothetical protein
MFDVIGLPWQLAERLVRRSGADVHNRGSDGSV